MRKSFRFKAKLNAGQVRRANAQLEVLRRLYNNALEERREVYAFTGRSVGFYAQSKRLPGLKRADPALAGIDAQAIEYALRNLDRAFDAFFRRVKAGGKPGFPRFKGRGRFRSATYRQNGWKLDGRHLTLRGIGRIKLFLSREIEGTIKTVTLARDRCGDWWITFSCGDVPVRPIPDTGQSIGVDVGLTSFLTTSDGEHVANPRHLRTAEAELKRAQRRVSRRKRGGSRRRKAVETLARKHRKVRRARRDFHFKTALDLVRRYDTIAVEDLNVRGLARMRLAKSVHDAGWGQFLATLAFKAESAGRKVVAVDPRGTSQVCSDCGAEPEKRKTLAVRTHRCPCGLTLDRDVNAARNILARAGPSGSGQCSRAAA